MLFAAMYLAIAECSIGQTFYASTSAEQESFTERIKREIKRELHAKKTTCRVVTVSVERRSLDIPGGGLIDSKDGITHHEHIIVRDANTGEFIEDIGWGSSKINLLSDGPGKTFSEPEKVLSGVYEKTGNSFNMDYSEYLQLRDDFVDQSKQYGYRVSNGLGKGDVIDFATGGAVGVSYQVTKDLVFGGKKSADQMLLNGVVTWISNMSDYQREYGTSKNVNGVSYMNCQYWAARFVEKLKTAPSVKLLNPESSTNAGKTALEIVDSIPPTIQAQDNQESLPDSSSSFRDNLRSLADLLETGEDIAEVRQDMREKRHERKAKEQAERERKAAEEAERLRQQQLEEQRKKKDSQKKTSEKKSDKKQDVKKDVKKAEPPKDSPTPAPATADIDFSKLNSLISQQVSFLRGIISSGQKATSAQHSQFNSLNNQYVSEFNRLKAQIGNISDPTIRNQYYSQLASINSRMSSEVDPLLAQGQSRGLFKNL